MAGVPVSGAQYGGDEFMKFRGGDVRLVGLGPEVVTGWGATAEVEGVRMGFTPLVEMGRASEAGFRGKLAS